MEASKQDLQEHNGVLSPQYFTNAARTTKESHSVSLKGTESGYMDDVPISTIVEEIVLSPPVECFFMAHGGLTRTWEWVV